MKVGDRVRVGALQLTGTIIRFRPPDWYHKRPRTVVVALDSGRIGWWPPHEVWMHDGENG